MATAHARRVYRGKKIVIGTKDRRWQWSKVFDHNPIIATPKEIRAQIDADWIVNGPGCRPYINYDAMEKPIKTAPKFHYHKIGPLEPGEIYFTEAEKARKLYGRFIVVDPNTDIKCVSVNKAWGFDKFQSVVDMLPDIRFVQASYGRPLLDGVETFDTANFRAGCRLVQDAIGFLGNEGGLHHAAAAVGTPAIVIFGSYHSPKVTGYASHINLSVGDEPCGTRAHCQHCRDAMNSITVDLVSEKVKLLFGDF